MFYLIEFFKTLKSNLLLSFIFIVSSVGLLTITAQQTTVEKEFSLSRQTSSLPYFNAIVSESKNIDSVVRRMKKLPGVITVEKHGVSRIKQRIENLKKVFGSQVVESLASVNYKRIKVEVEQGLNTGSLNLIKEYLTRLIGKDSVRIGTVKTPNNLKVKKDSFLASFLDWFDIYAQLVLGSLWFISAILIIFSVKKKAYIIEKFQRKTYTSQKIINSGFLVLSIFTLLVNFLIWGKTELSVFVLLFGMFTLLSFSTYLIKRRF